MAEAIPAHADSGAAFAASELLDNDNVLITDHVGLVHRVARRYVGLGVEYDDLVQAGMLGVLRAIKTFDPGRGRFSTYATPWIRQSIVREIQNNSRTIRVPVHQQFTLYRAGQLTTERLARLDAPLSDGDSTLHDFLGKSDDPTDKLARNEAQQHIAAAITELSDKQRAVVEWRFGEEELTLSEIGSRLGVSRARARQIEESALRALQREIKTQGVPDPSDDSTEEPESSYWPQYRGE